MVAKRSVPVFIRGQGRAAAHYLADHRGQVTREDAETVAESSTFVVLAHYGIDAGSYSFPYVARWAEDKAVLKRNLAEVRGIAAGLIAGIEEANRSTEE